MVSCPNVEGVEANYQEKGGYNYLFYLPGIKKIEYYYVGEYVGERLHSFTIRWDAEFLQAFVESSHSLP